MGGEQYVIGVDYGTLSGRALVVRVSDGREVGTAVTEYPHGVVDRELPGGGELPPDWALQVPADYVAVLRQAVPEAVRAAGVDPADVIGIGTDFTACTILPVFADGTPLCEVLEYSDRPHAYVKLWKHHAAQPQADRINALAAERAESWLPRYGGLISSEWEFAKALQLLEEDPELYHRMDHWVEAADWIVWQLTGSYVRNACTAGYKGIYQDGRYPERGLPGRAQPGLRRLRRAQARAPDRPARRARGDPLGPGGGLDRAARGDRGRRRQRRRARDRARRPGGRAGADARDHGHLDLPRDERRDADRGPGHVRRRGRRDRPRAVRLRGRPVRGRRHLRLVRRELRARRPTGSEAERVRACRSRST